jgi:hypothetical protein
MPSEKIPATPDVRKRAPRKSAARQADPAPVRFVEPERRASLIAEAAFFRAEKRGFSPGHEMEDWLAAESEVDALLMSAKAGPRV